MVGVDLGLNAVFEVLGRIAEVALDVVLRVAAHAFQSGGHSLHKRFLLLGLLERPGGLQVVDVGLVHRGYGVGHRAADLADEALHLDVVGLCHDELDEHGNAFLDAGGPMGTQTSRAMYSRFLANSFIAGISFQSVDPVLQVVHVLITFDGCRGKAVIVPPADQCGDDGRTGGDQLLQLGRLDGQDRLAAGAQQLVGQGQQQAGGAGDGASGDGGGVVLSDVCVHNVSSFLQCSRMGKAQALLYNSVPVPLPPIT